MADSGKTEHIPELIMERFSVRTLSESGLTNVARHLTGCTDCQANFVSTLRRQRGDADLSFTLAPEFWLRHEHLDYDQLINLAEDKLDATDREFIGDHLKVCPPCQEDVRSFLAFRRQVAPEMRVSYPPAEQDTAQERPSWVSWWRGFAWNPVYSTAVVLIGIALVIVVALWLSRRTDNQRVQQVPTPQVNPASTPAVATNLPSPTASPNESPTEYRSRSEAMVLSDQGRTITIDKSGKLAGMDDIPAPTRNEIAQVLLSGSIDRPSILKELDGQNSGLRGNNRDQPFKLITPNRTVIVSTRPTFKWEDLSGASAYQIYVNDQNGQVVAKSGELTPERTEWLVTQPMKRGEIYTWTVVATVNGREIVSPGSSRSEIKFQILSTDNLRKLILLKRTRSHLALGVFYSRVGLIAEAERELQQLVRLNQGSNLANRLLRSVRLMR